MSQFELDKTSSRDSLYALREFHEVLVMKVGENALVGVNHYEEESTQRQQMPFTD